MSKKHSPQKQRKLAILVGFALAFGIALAATLAAWQINQDEARRLELQQMALRPQIAETSHAVNFNLRTVGDKAVKTSDFSGKAMAVYFGYTYCPDECPTGLTGIAHALDQLGPDIDKIQPMFIDIDPKRDTIEKVAKFTATFHEKILPLSGTEKEINETANKFGFYYKEVREPDADEDEYEFDHAALIYLIDADGKLVASIPDDLTPQQMGAAFKAVINKAPIPAFD